MLRIESYVTPIILSYVDKYIKNLKPEDSKVSLWGGDAVFSNLDLKLDVLEQELKLPFSFLNGHIHELRIHVPWTKLISEPIVITINTIECILKLKNCNETNDESSTQSNKDSESSCEDNRRRQRRQDIETPTSYIQGLINKLINNVVIVFNNVILKYVEDDIVLSINAKAIEFRAVDHNWRSAFVDLTSENPVLRNFVSVTDLTVCLDKRNASGKIEVYQEPLLYRCSLSCRIVRQFESAYSFQPKNTRYDVFCSQLHFSLSDTQLPMFIRLLELLLALYYKQLQYQPPSSNKLKRDSLGESEDATFADGADGNTWSSWAWSIGSSLNPFQWEEYEDSNNASHLKYNSIYHIGIYIETATWVFKVTELSRDNTFFGASKMQFSPFLKVTQSKSFFNCVVKGLEAVNVQMGISSFLAVPLGRCVCGYLDFPEDTWKEEELHPCIFVESGEMNTDNYLCNSLFDENSDQLNWNYDFVWDDHLNNVNCLTSKANSFALDYLFMMDIPTDVTAEQLSEINDNPESSNWNSRALCRCIFGPFKANICSSFVHRISAIIYNCQQSEYSPYPSSQPEDVTEPMAGACEEDLTDLETNFPKREYVFTFMEPTVCLFYAQHKVLDIKTVLSSKFNKRSTGIDVEYKISSIDSLPSVSGYCSKIEFIITKPMYPKVLGKAAMSMKSISEKMLHNCHLYLTLKIYKCSLYLSAGTPMSSSILEKFSANLYFKSLLLPKLWVSSSHPLSETVIDTDELTIFLNMPQAHLIYYLTKSWFEEIPSLEKLQKTSLIEDVAGTSTSKFEMLKFEAQELNFKICKANHLFAWYFSIGHLSFVLCKANKEIISFIANGPDSPHNVAGSSSVITEKLFQLSMQFPVTNDITIPTVLYVHVLKFNFLFNPQFLLLLKYSPNVCSSKRNEEFVRNKSEVKFNSRKLWKKACESETENIKIESSSATFSEAKFSSRVRFGLKSNSLEETCPNWEERFIKFSSYMNSLIIRIEIESWTVFLPIKSVNITSNSGIVNAVHRLYLTRGEKIFLEDTAVICLPYILLHNANQKDHVFNLLHDLPISFNQMSFSEGKEKLPWSLKLTNFQVYTLQSAGGESMKLPLVKSVSKTATLAISPKLKGNSISQVGVVIHLDMSPLDFRICRRQAELLMIILERFFNIFSFYISLMKISKIPSALNETCIEKGSTKEKKSAFEEFPPKSLEAKEGVTVHKSLNYSFNREDSKVMDCTSTNSQKEFPVLKPSVSDQFLTSQQADGEELFNSIDETETKPSSAFVTLWVQLTIAKASATLFILESEAKKLKAEMEDFTLGVDLHQVYSKIKCKISNISVFHYVKKNSEWVRGDKGGVILTVGDELTRDLRILGPVNRHPPDCPKALHPTSVSHSDKHSKSCGFLSLVITKAQCKNIHSRWNQMVKKHLRDERCLKECSAPKYLCEVDFRMQSFDCVLFLPVLGKFAAVFEPCLHIHLPSLHISKEKSEFEKPLPFGSRINNRVFPLIYIHTEPIRVFLPADDVRIPTEHMQDVILIQLESLIISPHVDNPLSRLILRQDIFAAAQQARILAIPGSEVEDRQYQMDFIGFSISTGLWSDVKNVKNGRSGSFSPERMGITGENPAFEWNNYDFSKEKKDILIYPLIARLDTKVIFAPAIVYEVSGENSQLWETVFIAGHSLEINALTDCDLYASTNQICLVKKVVSDFLSVISNIVEQKQKRFGYSVSSDWLDSGIDCDGSSIEILKLSSLIEHTNDSNKIHITPYDFVPLEVLITGNKVSFNFYERCTVDENRLPLKVPQKNRSERRGKLKEKVLFLDVESTESETSPKKEKRYSSQESQLASAPIDANIEDGYEGSEEESVCEFHLISSEPQVRLSPILFILVLQPHTFFTLQPKEQKVDVSFFDVSVKSVAKGFSMKATEVKHIPNSEDYNTSWLETRPGDSHPKTGIPPAFFTFSAWNFLHKKAQMSIDIGRPIRVGFSSAKWEQIMHVISYMKILFPESSSLLSNNSEKSMSSTFNEVYFLNLFRSKLIRLENISFSTSQIVVNSEIISSADSKCELYTSFSSLKLNLSIVRKTQKQNNISEEFISELNLCSTVKGLQFKTSCYNLNMHSLLKPWSVNFEVKFIWYQWKIYPYVRMKMESEVLELEIGPETMHSLQKITAAFQNLLMWFSPEKENQSYTGEVGKFVNDLYSDSFFQDDLRSGVFGYLNCESFNSNLFPKPYQVLFDKAQNTMVWCYPEPRALVKVEIYPIPFVAANVDYKNETKHLFIPCSLQYFDAIRNSFVTYRRFKLSESQACSLDLPGIHESNMLAISTIWRVCINIDNDDGKQNLKGPIYVSPEALAACMKVDSLFSVNILPLVQIVFIINKLSLTFFNHLDVTGCKITSPIENFIPDNSIPNKHAFITFSFDNLISKFSAWSDECFFDIGCKISSKILNYKFLTNTLVLEPTSLFLDLTVKTREHIDLIRCCDCNLTIKRICVNIDQSSLHTFSIAKECWRQAFLILENFDSDPYIKQSLPIIFMTNYYIANKTVESIRFGQVNTAENVLLESGYVHFYSWRSQKFPTKLQICNESSRWKWCEAFRLDGEGTQVYSITNSEGKESKFYITLRKFSPTQMIISINGFLTIANCLYCDIDIRFTEKQGREDTCNKTSKSHNTISIKSRSFSPSFFCEPHSLRVKSFCSSVWSGEITLNQDSVTVRIPLKKKKDCMSVTCKIYKENVPSSSESKILVVFCPHIIVRSHLPRPLTLYVNTSSLNSSQKEIIKGRGNGNPLNCDPSQNHQVTLQLSPDMEVSKPPIQINRALLDQVKSSGKGPSDISSLINNILKCPSEQWPYIDSAIVESNLLFSDQPNINLQIEFSSLLPNCRSLVIDIRPWVLIINHTGNEILLQEGSDDNVWYITPGAVFAPPKLESTFAFGLVESEKRYFCSSLSLSTEEHWYALKFDGKVPKVGSINVAVWLEEKICFFTILSRYEENIQIMHLLPTYTISNNTDMEFTLRSIFLFGCEGKAKLLDTLSCAALHPNRRSTNIEEVPVLIWSIVKSSVEDETKSSLFLQLGTNNNYSFPIALRDSSRDLRMSFTVPGNDNSNEAFILTIHPKNSQIKLVIQKDPSPQMKIQNNTLVPLLVGQESLSSIGCIEEEQGPFNSVPHILPFKAIFYTFPYGSESFPEIMHLNKTGPRLHLALSKHSINNKQKVLWSHGLNISEENDQFVNIQGFSDVKVCIERLGHTAHVFIDPINRIEISAKDIRSRISSTVMPSLPLDENEKEEKCLTEENCDESENQEIPIETNPVIVKGNKNIYYFSFKSSNFSLVFREDLNKENFHLEFILLTFDNLHLNIRPYLVNHQIPESCHSLSRNRMEIILTIEDAQIDNQLFSEGNFDFPVILIGQKNSKDVSRNTGKFLCENGKFLYLTSLVDISPLFAIQDLNITVQPITLYLEDTLIYYSLLFFNNINTLACLEVKQLKKNDVKALKILLPNDILIKSNSMTRPLQIENLNIESVSVLLSIHASAKLYIALDQSPLYFKEYQRKAVITTGYSLGYNLTVHYLSNALLRAGWVVTSLDLLGNPGGFARTVGSGLKDFVQLPIEGILQGPWAFVAGITHGSMSLVKHISTGTLVSVTNLASSVARNMERLSLDEDHLTRNEANRRCKSKGISSSVLQGLSSFGLSILGAVGGLAHQPIQAVLQDDVSASQLIGSFGKGVVGMVTKPIGGVADLVVHTGQGLLQGAGWKQDLKPRASSQRVFDSSFTNSPLKFIWKLLVSLPKECRTVVCSVDAMLLTHSSSYSPVTILLTPQVLFIVDVEEDSHQQVFTLHDIKWKIHPHDPTLLYLEKLPRQVMMMNEDAEPISGCPERVADYVRSTYSECFDVSQIDYDSNDDEREETQVPKAKLYLSSQLRSFLITCIEITVRSNKGQGFISQ